MILRNPDLKKSIGLYVAGGLLLGIPGFSHSLVAGLLVLLCSFMGGILFYITERKRYLHLQKLTQNLDTLLHHGIPLPIEDYQEGELSILANQVQKLTLRLTDAQSALQRDKTFLADSLADVSHQLRTPLTAMHLTLSLLQSQEAESKNHKALLRDLQSLLRRTQWLVEALLKLSKLDAGTVCFHQKTTSLPTLLEQALEPLAIAIELQQQKVILDCPPCTLYCDPTWTVEAIGNVLKNAMEHNPTGGEIRITGRDTPIFTEITIEDEGGGFPPEELPHIFERFFHGKGGNSKNCGIGLSLSRKILTAQNGTIQGENRGKGARFTIKIYKQVI